MKITNLHQEFIFVINILQYINAIPESKILGLKTLLHKHFC
jgi:hypothetical protein